MTETSDGKPVDKAPPPDPSTMSDDESVATAKVGETTKPNDQEMKEFVLRFEFHPKNPTLSTRIAQTHIYLLYNLQFEFEDNLIIIDNKNKKLPEVNPVEWGAVKHQQHFNIHLRRANDNRKESYSILHRVRTNQSLSTLKNGNHMKDLLKKYNCYMRKHAWNEDEHSTILAGYAIGINPEYYDPAHAHSLLTQTIQKAMPRAKMPAFKMVYSSPAINLDSGAIARTKAYAIEILRETVSTAMPILKEVFKGTNQLLPGKMKYTHPKAFLNGIKLQNQMLGNTYVIVLTSISPEMMFYIKEKIKSYPGILDVIQTRKTDTEGRWHVVVTKTHFTKTRTQLASDFEHEIIPLIATDAFPPTRTYGCQAGVVIRADDNSSGENSFMSVSANSFATLDLSSVPDTYIYQPSVESAYSFPNTWAEVARPKIPTTIEHVTECKAPTEINDSTISSPTTITEGTPTSVSELSSQYHTEMQAMQVRIKSLELLIRTLQSTVQQSITLHMTTGLHQIDRTMPDPTSSNPSTPTRKVPYRSPESSTAIPSTGLRHSNNQHPSQLADDDPKRSSPDISRSPSNQPPKRQKPKTPEPRNLHTDFQTDVHL